ncbi:hypothetical protein [Saliphagus sp. LR7]|nr:hypothetical protein [Saliphagus sp. LR7]
MGVMSTHDTPALGICPECAAAIAPARVLIEYERGGGEVTAFAECPGCREVIRPV